jgi:DNA-binding NarL/FixJ family response regulator
MNILKVGIVDDQQLFRQGLASILKKQTNLALVLEAGSGAACLSALAALDEFPDVLLIDMEMPQMDGDELNEAIHNCYPSIRVLILSVHANERLIARMIEKGASGYLTKTCDQSELIDAIETVHKTGFYVNPQVLKAIQDKTGQKKQQQANANFIPLDLTPREQEILSCICRQYSNAEIAARLFISIRTVEGHRNHLLLKTGARNTAGLVLFALRYHLYELIG